jgi:hypothetical protein
MRDDFNFTCPNLECEKENSVNRTSSGEPIPEYNDEPKDFYVTCPHCFHIFRVEYIVVLTEMMFSNKGEG